MGIDIRYIAEDQYQPFAKAVEIGFGHHISESSLSGWLSFLKHARVLAAFDDEEIVGGSMVFPLKMNISPNRVASTAVVSGVAVTPTHRRRGILTKMMDIHLREAYDRGEIVSVLGASESIIYGRFGYGLATYDEGWKIDRRHTDFAHSPHSPGKLRFIGKDEALEMLLEVAARACSDRLGFVAVNDDQWAEVLRDWERRGDGSENLFFVVYQENGRTDGYVIYQLRGETVMIFDLMPVTAAAHAALWKFCFGIDLRTTIEAVARPVDDPLPWMLADPRRLERMVKDAMWLRVVDVRKALEERRYAVEGSIVLKVQDTFCPWNDGCYDLEGGPDGARCKPTSAKPHITLSADSLGAAYLGGVSFDMLARSQRAEANSPQAVHTADAMFRTHLKPWWPHEL